MNRSLLLGLVFVFAGLFTFAGAFFDWDWYMNHRKARFMVKILGRTGARFFYGIFGGIIAVFGILVTFGFIDLSS